MNWPNEPVGNSAMLQWCRRLLQICRTSAIIPGPGYTLKQGAKGTIIGFNIPAAQVTSSFELLKGNYSSSLGDYILLTDGTAVAKPYKIRNSITREKIYGNDLTFTYPHNPVGGGPSVDPLAYLYRVASAGGLVTENEGVNPQYLSGTDSFTGVGDEISYVPATTGIMTDPLDPVGSPGGVATAVAFLQVSTAAAWTRFSNQSL